MNNLSHIYCKILQLETLQFHHSFVSDLILAKEPLPQLQVSITLKVLSSSQPFCGPSWAKWNTHFHFHLTRLSDHYALRIILRSNVPVRREARSEASQPVPICTDCYDDAIAILATHIRVHRVPFHGMLCYWNVWSWLSQQKQQCQLGCGGFFEVGTKMQIFATFDTRGSGGVVGYD